MSNLTPQKRLDKNGRLVTRHVLSNANTRARSFPSVATPPTLEAQSNEFRKLSSFWKSLKSNEMNALYPVAHVIAPALEGSDFAYLISNIDTEEPEWVESLTATCHFINRIGPVKDAETISRALDYIAMNYGVKKTEFPFQDDDIQHTVSETLSVIESSRFARQIIDHEGTAPVAFQQEFFTDHLYSKVAKGQKEELELALADLDGFLDYDHDEIEDSDVVANLRYVDLIDYVIHVQKTGKTTTAHALQLVKNHRHNVSAAREVLDTYEGSGVLIDGAL